MDQVTYGLIHNMYFDVCNVVYWGAIKSILGEVNASLLKFFKSCTYTSTSGLCNHQLSRSEGESSATEDSFFFENLQEGGGRVMNAATVWLDPLTILSPHREWLYI